MNIKAIEAYEIAKNAFIKVEVDTGSLSGT
jgi:hypothetical protein